MSWLIIALTASFLFGMTNFIDRFLVEKRIKDPFFVSIIGGIAAVIAAGIIIGMRGLSVLGWGDAGILLLSGFVSIIALVPWYKAIKIDDTSRVVPFFQLIPVVVLGLSYLLLDERLTRDQLIGFVLIIGGGLSLAVERPSQELFRIRRSFWYVLLSIMLWEPVAVLFKMVAIGGNFWDALVYEMIGAGLGSVALRYYARINMWSGLRALSIGTWGIVGTNEVLYLAARGLLFYATLIGPTALVSVVGGIQPLFALITGVVMSIWFPEIIREDIKRGTLLLKLSAIAVILVGLVCVYL